MLIVLALHSHHAVDCCKHNRLDFRFTDTQNTEPIQIPAFSQSNPPQSRRVAPVCSCGDSNKINSTHIRTYVRTYVRICARTHASESSNFSILHKHPNL